MGRAAARRIPKFAFDFLDGGIGAEACLAANRAALDAVQLAPRYLVDESFEPELGTSLFGEAHPLPFGAAPLGLSGLFWPRAAEHIAAAATRAGLPVGLSSFATSSIEEVAAIAGDKLWFQLYTTNRAEVDDDLMARARAAGCRTLIVTIDIPTATRRERDMANGLAVPPRIAPKTLWQAAIRPRWALATAAAGRPRFRSMLPYVPNGASLAETARFLTDLIEGHVTPATLKRIRDRWPGRLIVKGVLTAADAVLALEAGADALVVSNHGGRQLDAAPPVPALIPVIREAVGPELPLLADGGVRSGLDVARLIACGADFVLLGRAFAYAVAAAGPAGPGHAIAVLREELRHSLSQSGCRTLAELRERLV